MSEEEKRKEEQGLSRREFLKDAGLVVGGATLGSMALLSACSKPAETVTDTATVTSTINSTKTVTGPGTTVTTTVTGPGSTVTVSGAAQTVATTAPAVTVTSEPTSVTILNPEGQIEDIPLTPLVKRVTTGFDGKNIYVVSVNFTGTEAFLQELQKALQLKYPKANVVYKIKEGSYAASDTKLWDEVKAKAAVFVMGVGH
jgi:hypothetical protein